MPNFSNNTTGSNANAIVTAIEKMTLASSKAVTPRQIAKEIGEPDYEKVKKSLQKYRRQRMHTNRELHCEEVILNETDTEKKILYCRKGGGGAEAQYQVEILKKAKQGK